MWYYKIIYSLYKNKNKNKIMKHIKLFENFQGDKIKTLEEIKKSAINALNSTLDVAIDYWRPDNGVQQYDHRGRDTNFKDQLDKIYNTAISDVDESKDGSLVEKMNAKREIKAEYDKCIKELYKK